VNNKKLKEFLIKARARTYAGSGGKVEPLLEGSKQLEFSEKEYRYRDIYYVGGSKFSGIEVIYLLSEPVWSMSYYGNFTKMTEDEIDNVLRQALIGNKKTARLWHEVSWQKDDFRYLCLPEKGDSIDEIIGSEKIFKDENLVYYFKYAGGILGK
jgi:hypothetical protein